MSVFLAVTSTQKQKVNSLPLIPDKTKDPDLHKEENEEAHQMIYLFIVEKISIRFVIVEDFNYSSSSPYTLKIFSESIMLDLTRFISNTLQNPQWGVSELSFHRRTQQSGPGSALCSAHVCGPVCLGMNLVHSKSFIRLCFHDSCPTTQCHKHSHSFSGVLWRAFSNSHCAIIPKDKHPAWHGDTSGGSPQNLWGYHSQSEAEIMSKVKANQRLSAGWRWFSPSCVWRRSMRTPKASAVTRFNLIQQTQYRWCHKVIQLDFTSAINASYDFCWFDDTGNIFNYRDHVRRKKSWFNVTDFTEHSRFYK